MKRKIIAGILIIFFIFSMSVSFYNVKAYSGEIDPENYITMPGQMNIVNGEAVNTISLSTEASDYTISYQKIDIAKEKMDNIFAKVEEVEKYITDNGKLLEEKEKNVHIALDKAYWLEKMVNEFFEITRYHSKQIKLEKQPVDLYYMLMQLRDEFLPSFSLHNNTVSLDLDENITIYADPEKIARVFGNIMKNAAAYSYPNTTITIAATQEAQYTTISFQNKGKTIPAERLSSLFDKFYRLDEARISDTGGTGLGLAIAKEIILLHGGTIEARSEQETVTFIIRLPITES